MSRFRLGAFWRAVLLVAAAYLVFSFAFPPVMPRSALIQYMVVILSAVLLYYSFDDQRWAEFKAPILALLRAPDMRVARRAVLIVVPLLAAYAGYGLVKPSNDAPVELRQVHPAPPNSLTAYGKTYDLTTLENPIRKEVLEYLSDDPERAHEIYRKSVETGSGIYYRNCFYCHGDLLDGHGMFASGLSPPPANFRDVGTIAQLQEAYLFWRITTGGPGLPREGAPWNSAMPSWRDMLGERDIWNVIMFLYDHVGQVPRMWQQKVSRAVSALSEEVRDSRRDRDGAALYQFHCAVCHGPSGEGNGPAAAFLYPKPRDFTIGMFKYKTSPFKTYPPTDEDLFHTIRDGLPGTGMPAWKTLLTDTEIRKLIPVIKRFDLVGTWAPEDAPDEKFDDDGQYLGQLSSIAEQVALGNPVPFTEESVTKGKALFNKTCALCHGRDGRGNPSVDKRLKDEWGDRIWPRDLTQPWSWRVTNIADSAEETIHNIFTRLSVGIPGTPMPEHADKIDEEDRWHIANYVYTLRDTSVPPTKERVIRAARIKGPLPNTVNDNGWAAAEAVDLPMIPNVIKGERLFKPLHNALTVRALYNDREIAILMEVDDRTYSRPGDPDAERTRDRGLELFSDAFAIQFPKAASYRFEPTMEKPLFRHGDAAHPTTVWYWRAGSVDPEAAPMTIVFDARGESRKLAPRPGEIDVTAAGAWDYGRWRVLFKRPREATNIADLAFSEGKFMPVSFANWDGNNGEKGSRHKLTPWYWLYMPPPVAPIRLFGVPGAAWLVTLLLLGLIFGHHRRKAKT